MKISFNIKYSFVLLLAFLISNRTSAQKAGGRTITIAGLVVDAESLLPLAGASLFDAGNTKLGETDEHGYFNVKQTYTKKGQLNFKLSLRKAGYKTFLQHENWADVPAAQAVMYFGMQNTDSKIKEFSTFGDDKNQLGYESVLNGFSKVRAEQDFNAKLEHAKSGNQDVLVQVDGKFYIVDSTGWIKVAADTDLVAINDKQILPANKLNAVVKRDQIKGMTPVDAADKKFVIYTK